MTREVVARPDAGGGSEPMNGDTQIYVSGREYKVHGQPRHLRSRS